MAGGGLTLGCVHIDKAELTTQLSLGVVEDLLLVAEDVVVHIELIRCRALERQSRV